MEINNDNDLRTYYQLLSKLITDFSAGYVDKDQNKEKIYATLTEICKFFRLSKGSTLFYNTEHDEKIGKIDEEYICYEEKSPSEPVYSFRKVVKVGAVVICTVYMKEGVTPLTDYEKGKLHEIMLLVTSFVALKRIQRIIVDLTYDDGNGYSNLRYYQRYLNILNDKGIINEMFALRYNLRHFALVNQEIGRQAADLVMRAHYNKLQEIAGKNGAVCRLGGDNFVAICEKNKLEEVENFLRGALIEYDDSQNKMLITSSAGLFIIPDDFVMRDHDEIISKIAITSQIAKTSGADQIIRFENGMLGKKSKEMYIQNIFPIALKKEEFKVFYQPKVDVENGQLVGAEALCRWFKDGAIVSPAEFIPVLESTTDICKLDFYMLDHVCRDIKRWLDSGKNIVRVSVNLSRKHMMNVNLLNDLLEIVDRHSVPHEYIEIELTETTTDVEFKDIKRVVYGLQQAGISTSVDDFGIGYSSLNLIRAVPWNVLKIDKSFLPVEEDGRDSVRGIMFRNVVAMTQQLGMECIAEGVETERQVNVLRENGCKIAQGFFYDKPLPVNEFEERLNAGKYDI